MKQFDFSELPRVNESAIACSADIRSQANYFQVEEVLPFEPDGVGGHVWLKIQKRGTNTDWLARELAKFAKVPSVAVGYAGLKDRHAVTTQWFSVNMEGHDQADWQAFESDDIQIIELTQHGKKLKRGALAGNKFSVRLTEIQGDRALWNASLKNVQQHGVPNYFAEQRFGHQGNNLRRVEHWFSSGKAPRKRQQKSIFLSAARSWLFNLVLAERIRLGSWNKVLAGDIMLLAGTKASLFRVDEADQIITERIDKMDVHPTAPLWGRGSSLAQADSLIVEQQALFNWSDWQQGLEEAGLSQQRRSLRLFPDNFDWEFMADRQLNLTFFLPAGSYATAIMRELALVHQPYNMVDVLVTDVQQRNYPAKQSITHNESSIIS